MVEVCRENVGEILILAELNMISLRPSNGFAKGLQKLRKRNYCAKALSVHFEKRHLSCSPTLANEKDQN